MLIAAKPERSKNHLTRLDQRERARRRSPFVALSFFYSLVRRILEVLRVHCMDAAAKDAEILVSAHLKDLLEAALLSYVNALLRFTEYFDANRDSIGPNLDALFGRWYELA